MLSLPCQPDHWGPTRVECPDPWPCQSLNQHLLHDDTHFTAPANYYYDDMTNDAGRAVFYDRRSNTLSGGNLPGLIVTWPDDQMTHVLLIANPKND